MRPPNLACSFQTRGHYMGAFFPLSNDLLRFGCTPRSRQILNLDLLEIHVGHRLGHSIQHLVKGKRFCVLGTEPDWIDSWHVEALEVGARHPSGLEAFHLSPAAIVERVHRPS